MVFVECPVEGCEYTGSVGSVEGHISASQSGGHGGEVGRHFREELVEQAEETINGGATDSEELPESPDVSGDEDRSEEGGSASEDDPSIPPGKAVVASTLGLVLLYLGGTAETETEVEAAGEEDEQAADDPFGWPGDDPAGGLVDG